MPLAPKELSASFAPNSMEGTWYKVLGWNRQYDCFDCQKNTFRVEAGPEKAQTAALNVDFSMVARRRGVEKNADLHMQEQVVFDQDIFLDTKDGRTRARRTAHTQGRMFGLTFWENWYVIGENKPGEAPFKFVYYTGKTLQNTYSGAFVYARSPEAPPESLSHIYQIAREAGIDPDKFCRIRNSCFLRPEQPRAPLAAEEVAYIISEDQPDERSLAKFSSSISPSLQLRAKAFWYEVMDYLEDPKEAARWMFDQQQRMVWPSPGDTESARASETGSASGSKATASTNLHQSSPNEASVLSIATASTIPQSSF